MYSTRQPGRRSFQNCMMRFGARMPTSFCQTPTRACHCMLLSVTSNSPLVSPGRVEKMSPQAVRAYLQTRAVFDASACTTFRTPPGPLILPHCRDCALDDSCVLCSRCFHATDHKDHHVSFFIAQQSGGCGDCGDEEAWQVPIGCPFHPPSSQPVEIPEPRFHLQPPKTVARATLTIDLPPVKNYAYRVAVPLNSARP